MECCVCALRLMPILVLFFFVSSSSSSVIRLCVQRVRASATFILTSHTIFKAWAKYTQFNHLLLLLRLTFLLGVVVVAFVVVLLSTVSPLSFAVHAFHSVYSFWHHVVIDIVFAVGFFFIDLIWIKVAIYITHITFRFDAPFPFAFLGNFGRFFGKIKLNIQLSANEIQMGCKTVAKYLFFAFEQTIKSCTELSRWEKKEKKREKEE